MHSILIADDDPLQRRTVRRMLEADLAVEVIEAGDGGNPLAQVELAQRRIADSERKREVPPMPPARCCWITTCWEHRPNATHTAA
jgi:CheY-like chemotaxis protein